MVGQSRLAFSSMLDPNLTLAYLIVATTVALSPGPDVLFVLANGLQHKARGAIAAAAGIAIGSLIHGLAAALGVAALLAANPLWFEVLRYAGAIYLIWLGIQSWRKLSNTTGRHGPRTNLTVQPKSTLSIFQSGLLTNLLNPKVIIFYLALLPQFVSLDIGRPGLQIFLLGTIHALIGLIYLIIIGVLAGTASASLARSRIGPWLNRISGAIFIALALRLMVQDLN